MLVLFEAPRGTKAFDKELLLQKTVDCVPREGDSLVWNVDGDDDSQVWEVAEVRWFIPGDEASDSDVCALVKLVPAELIEKPPGEPR